MKLEGQKKGVSDIMIACPSKDYHGAWIELKVPGNKPSPEQIDWLDRTRAVGYFSVVHTTSDVQTLIKLVEDYLTPKN
jgi:hypothetical protein